MGGVVEQLFDDQRNTRNALPGVGKRGKLELEGKVGAVSVLDGSTVHQLGDLSQTAAGIDKAAGVGLELVDQAERGDALVAAQQAALALAAAQLQREQAGQELKVVAQVMASAPQGLLAGGEGRSGLGRWTQGNRSPLRCTPTIWARTGRTRSREKGLCRISKPRSRARRSIASSTCPDISTAGSWG